MYNSFSWFFLLIVVSRMNVASNLQCFRHLLGYARDKSRPIITLKGIRQSKSGDTFLKEGFN